MVSSSPRSVHVPVMPREVLHWLQLSPGLTVLDGTVGAGGHSSLILKQLGPNGRVLGLDRDPMMLQLARETLKDDRCELLQSSYADAADILESTARGLVDRVLLDLGLSSDQLADRDRGFGFDAGGELDMRFDVSTGKSCATVLAEASESELERIFRDHGEEPAAGRIAVEIIKRRMRGDAISTAADLEDCVRSAVAAARNSSDRNPSTRVFQALRIHVNRELEIVERMVTQTLPRILQPGGIVVIISFHSLEDRIIKNAFKGLDQWQVLTKTPVAATPAEIRLNPRSRSAKLRAARWMPVKSRPH